MKTQSSFLRIVSIVILFALGSSYGSEGELVNLMAASLKGTEISAHLELPAPLPDSGERRRKLKQIEAFGIKFSGQAAFKETSLLSVTLWCDEIQLAPDAALRLFSRISDTLRPRIGEGKIINNVPSFEDAFDPKTQVMLWVDGSEMIVLSVNTYPTRAGLSLQRIGRLTWLDEMGADQGEFWDKALKANGMAASPPSLDPPPTQTPSNKEQTIRNPRLPPLVPPPMPTAPVPLPAVKPDSSAPTPVTQIPAATVDSQTPMWKWILGFAAIAVIALLVRSKR